MDAHVFRAWIVSAAGVIEANRDHLTQLDAAIGDADHGINLARGFTAVLGALEAEGAKVATPGAILTVTGNTLISKVGGASGPLYGMAFRRAGKALGNAADVDLPALSAALDAALAGVQQLGAAREGDKTMVAAASAGRSTSGASPSALPARRKATPYSGPEAPPTLEISVAPVSVSTAPGVAGAAVSSALSTAVNPRARLMP